MAKEITAPGELMEMVNAFRTRFISGKHGAPSLMLSGRVLPFQWKKQSVNVDAGYRIKRYFKKSIFAGNQPADWD
jgi:hypothetical protein